MAIVLALASALATCGPEKPIGEANVIADRLALLDGPSASARVVAVVKQNTRLELLEPAFVLPCFSKTDTCAKWTRQAFRTRDAL